MKSLMPWLSLVVVGGSGIAEANGIDAYRLGNYDKATTELVTHDALSDYYAGRMSLYGYGSLKNNVTAIRYFKESAEKGLLIAQQFMGRYALFAEKNPEQALYWFKKSAEANDLDSQLYCAAAYLFGVGTKKNSELAKKYYIAAAKAGNAIAQYTLAEHFLDSRQASNKKLGLIWLNKAVAQNNPSAQMKLALLYLNGELVEADAIKAKSLAQAALDQGYTPAMMVMGQIALKEGKVDEAKDWYTKASKTSMPAAQAFAELYLQENSGIYDPKLGFLWMLKAAQEGLPSAQLALADMYKKGLGVPVDENLSKEWLSKAKQLGKENPALAQVEAAKWLSLGKINSLAASGYALKGILTQWQNPNALRENRYNQSPRMEQVSRKSIYQPKFELINPNDIPINDYYDALVSLTAAQSEGIIPVFPHYGFVEENPAAEFLSKLQNRAVVGDHTAQFALGQFYEEGRGVKKDIALAIKYYELASAQQDLRAEYNLGLLYLRGAEGIEPDYQKARGLLTNAAFKGNDYAEYALAMIEEQGYKNAAGEVVIPMDAEQATAMYYLAAANGSGLAQYRLGQLLTRDNKVDMSLAGKQKRWGLIKNLYGEALRQGVKEAALPLAFFNAADSDPATQQKVLEVAQSQARDGNAEAALLLGLLHDRGIGVEKDHDEAIRWYQQASLNPVGRFILGTYFVTGNGVTEDAVKGEALLKQSAEANFSYAYLNLGIVRKQGEQPFLPDLEKASNLGNSKAGLLLADYYLSLANNDQQMQQARTIYQQLAEKGDKDGQLKFGFMLEEGLGGSADVVTAEHWYRLSAEQGQPVSQFLLGRMYQLGRINDAPDYLEAKKWYSAARDTYSPAAVALGFIYDTVEDDYPHALENYEKAAINKDIIGQFNLALAYEQGKGRAVNFDKAYEWYTLPAEKGYAPAVVQLAGFYLQGHGTKRDIAQAQVLYKKAAMQGDRDALYQLGLIAETGAEVSKPNYQVALQYYERSADKGDEKAMLALARMYQHGLGVEKNKEKSEEIYQRLAVKGNAQAQYHLAVLCYEGINGRRDVAKAKKLLTQAQENGSPQARKMLERLATEEEKRVSFIESLGTNPKLASTKSI